MFKINHSDNILPIPYTTEYFVDRCGNIYLNDNHITLDEFNHRLGYEVESGQLLAMIAFQGIRLPPAYWGLIEMLTGSPELTTPENTLMGFKTPIESLDFPNYYMIPYYSDYVINREGVLIRKSSGTIIQASKAGTEYYTFRMSGDDDRTGNRLRHRILCMAFKRYRYDMSTLDVNHLNGIPGSDDLSNLEWCTRSENMNHAYAIGLRDDNKPVTVRDMNTNQVVVYISCSRAALAYNVSQDTVQRYSITEGTKSFNGLQFRYGTRTDNWPEIDDSPTGDYKITFPDGRVKMVGGTEAARAAGVTVTSLRRLIREGRNKGKTDVIIERI